MQIQRTGFFLEESNERRPFSLLRAAALTRNFMIKVRVPSAELGASSGLPIPQRQPDPGAAALTRNFMIKVGVPSAELGARPGLPIPQRQPDPGAAALTPNLQMQILLLFSPCNIC